MAVKPHRIFTVRRVADVASILLALTGVYVLTLVFSPALEEIPVIRAQQQQQVKQAINAPIGAINKLFIPRIGVAIKIVEGSDETALLSGAWHRLPEHGNPAVGGNFVLSAHRFNMGYTPAGTIKKSPFYRIDKIQIGDDVIVNWAKKQYHYTVTKLYKVAPSQVSIERTTKQPQLTLYSCTLRGSLDGRDVVIATPTEE